MSGVKKNPTPKTKVTQKTVKAAKNPPGDQRGRGKSLQGARELMKRENVAKNVRSAKQKTKSPPAKGKGR